MIDLQKEFVPYDRALRLKALGFDEPCLAYYEKKVLKEFRPYYLEAQILNSDFSSRIEGFHLSSCSAPTFSQAFRWFREKHDLCSHVRMFDGEFTFEINEVEFVLQSKETHEKAELACLTKLIEIVETED